MLAVLPGLLVGTCSWHRRYAHRLSTEGRSTEKRFDADVADHQQRGHCDVRETWPDYARAGTSLDRHCQKKSTPIT